MSFHILLYMYENYTHDLCSIFLWMVFTSLLIYSNNSWLIFISFTFLSRQRHYFLLCLQSKWFTKSWFTVAPWYPSYHAWEYSHHHINHGCSSRKYTHNKCQISILECFMFIEYQTCIIYVTPSKSVKSYTKTLHSAKVSNIVLFKHYLSLSISFADNFPAMV